MQTPLPGFGERLPRAANSEVRWLDNLLYLYTKPFETSAVTVQKYAEDLSVLPPVEVNQRHELIDGWHRWTAHFGTNPAG